MKMARYHTGRDKFIAFLGAFHGRTMGALSLTGCKSVQRRGFAPLVPGVTHVPYRLLLPLRLRQAAPRDCRVECVKVHRGPALQDHPAGRGGGGDLRRTRPGRGRLHRPAARSSSTSWRRWPSATASCWSATRCSAAWAAPAGCWPASISASMPDIVTLAKGIASGLPLERHRGRAREYMQWTPGSHASTFGGNPVSVEAALATIELLEEELMENAARMGAYMHGPHARVGRRASASGRRRARPGPDAGRRDRARPGHQGEERRHAQSRSSTWPSAAACSFLARARTRSAWPPLTITRDQAAFAIETMEECLNGRD